MRRRSAALAAGSLGLAVALSAGPVASIRSAAASPPQASHRNVASSGREPRTVPALRHWRPASGRWQLGGHARIVVRRTHHHALLVEGHQLARDLRPVIGRRLPVVVGDRNAVEPGDVALAMTSTPRPLPRAGYALRVGLALTVMAPYRLGVFYGGRTVIQLLAQGRSVPRGRARDWPRYPQRGLMVDAARTVYTRGWVEREIRELALLKLNILHLHLTDDQRWGIASRAFPGVVSSHAFSRKDIRAILRVARRYHVTVIPEIDMPGHMAAFLAKHPKLELKPLGVVGSSHPSEYVTDKLDITKPAVRHDVRRILDEYLPMFPGRYWDMGDDEYLTPGEAAVFPQLATYAIRKYGVGATPADAVHGFINWVDKIVRAHHKTLRVWNDQLAGPGVVGVNHNVVVDWWTSVSPFGDPLTVSPKRLLAEGYRVLNAGWYPNYYTANLGPVAGMANMASVYRSWAVNDFDGPELSTGTVSTRQPVPAASRGLLGDAMSIWGPLPQTPKQTAAGIAPGLAVIAQKTWDSRPVTASYPAFRRLARRVGAG